MQVERLLDSVDAVIYVLDYTKLKTADEAEVLCKLREINPQLMDRLSQRLFFVVNKADMIETSEGMDAAATKQYVADLITQQMHIEGFQLKQEQVCTYAWTTSLWLACAVALCKQLPRFEMHLIRGSLLHMQALCELANLRSHCIALLHACGAMAQCPCQMEHASVLLLVLQAHAIA